jgi:exopolyphosphatase/guanosine-5'-triphosphate,3'-diphosphate pyrophosphatase
MADTLPPDRHRSAGNQRGDTSGNVADPCYARSFQPDETGERPSQGRGAERCHSPENGHGRNRRESDASSGRGSPAERGVRGTSLAQDAARRPAARGAVRGEAYAALDLGTNNCRLLIARPSGRDFTVIDAFSRVVKLGEGLATTGRLSDQAMDRALCALSICADKLRRRNVRLARSVATEACRRAENGAEFIERVRRETGIALDIISAEEEARLAVLGCHILLEAGEGPAMIFDIGGGSTELVLLEAGETEGRRVPRILDWQSVPWGVVSLTDTVGNDEGPDGEAGRAGRLERYARMRELVRDSFADFADRIGEAPRANDIRLLGTSGTVTTLASLHLELPQYDRKAVDGLIVCSDDMRAISTRLSGMSPAERCTLPCIGNDRADLVVAGCAILETILDLWPAARLGVADRGIREGILRSMMAADRQGERALKKLRGERPMK